MSLSQRVHYQRVHYQRSTIRGPLSEVSLYKSAVMITGNVTLVLHEGLKTSKAIHAAHASVTWGPNHTHTQSS